MRTGGILTRIWRAYNGSFRLSFKHNVPDVQNRNGLVTRAMVQLTIKSSSLAPLLKSLGENESWIDG